MSLPIIYFSVFLFAIIFFDALIRFLLTAFERKKYINYRVQLLEGNLDRKAVYERMLKERAVQYGDSSSFLASVRRFVSQANIKLTLSRIVLYIIGAFLVIYAVVGYLGGSTALPTGGRGFWNCGNSIALRHQITVGEDHPISKATSRCD